MGSNFPSTLKILFPTYTRVLSIPSGFGPTSPDSVTNPVGNPPPLPSVNSDSSLFLFLPLFDVHVVVPLSLDSLRTLSQASSGCFVNDAQPTTRVRLWVKVGARGESVPVTTRSRTVILWFHRVVPSLPQVWRRDSDSSPPQF